MGKGLAAGVACVITLSSVATALAGGGRQWKIKLNRGDQAEARTIVTRHADLQPANGWQGNAGWLQEFSCNVTQLAVLHADVMRPARVMIARARG